MINTIKAKIFWRKKEYLMRLGLKTGLIRPYSEKFIKNLRELNYGGVPASVLLLNLPSCKQKCYDRALIACFGLRDLDYQMVDMDVDFIKYSPFTIREINKLIQQGIPINSHYANHCVIEFKEFGKDWILDTTQGLIFEKKLYFMIESPKITNVNSKENILCYPEYIEIENDSEHPGNIPFSTVIIPMIESNISNQDFPYKDALLEELRIYKEKIDYKSVVHKELKLKLERGYLSDDEYVAACAML